MSHRFSSRRVARVMGWLIIALMLWSGAMASTVAAQSDEVREWQRQAREYLEASNFVAALPLLEKVAVALPNDAPTHFYLGYAIYARSKTLPDAAQRRQLRVKARQSFAKAKELGFTAPLLQTLLESLPPDGGGEEVFSQNTAADTTMREGEAFFTQGKLAEAIAAYQRALQADPKLYEAALFTGDVYLKSDDFAQAEVWYQKAIAIDPNRETAYRYSATPLMRQQKLGLARDRYVEAYVVDPYNRLTNAGLSEWAKASGVRLGHPEIDIPTNVTNGPDGKININLNALGADKKDDGTAAWTIYGILRAGWQISKDPSGLSESFRKAYPNEKKYRHSLAEEMSALGLVISRVKDDLQNKKIKNLDPSLARLIKLSDAGLLEAYVLLARADRGLAQDYPQYLQTNRDKLRRYVVEYVLTGGGQ